MNVRSVFTKLLILYGCFGCGMKPLHIIGPFSYHTISTCGLYINSDLFFPYFHFYLLDEEPCLECKGSFGPVLLCKCQPGREEPEWRQGHVRNK